MVVAADGVRSQVRRLVFGDAVEPRYAGQCVWRARVPRRGDARLDMWQADGVIAGIDTVSDDTSYLFCLVSHETPPRHDREQFARLLREDLGQFDRGLVAWSKDQLTAESHIHFSPMMHLIVPSPWHRGRVLLVGDAAHATTPHIAYGAGLAIEDGVVLAEEVARSGSLGEALDRFTERRHARCRMVVEGGVQISDWQQSRRDHSADQAGLTDQIWRSLAEPI
jgi:2-polyprenyl-6-methoxyphenol hydroxylase-like FAD-dependent oxidoreductase